MKVSINTINACRYSHVIAIGAFAFALSVFPFSDGAAAQPANASITEPTVEELGGQALIDAAIKEGAVTFYTVEVPGVHAAHTKAFNARFPQIKVEVVRQSSAPLDTLIKAELQANRLRADIVTNIGNDLMSDYRNSLKMLADYKPPSADKYKAEDTNNGQWYPISAIVVAFAYNTGLVKEADAPKSWAEFLNPAFNGRRGYIVPNSNCSDQNIWFTGQVLGIQAGKDYQSYWKALAATKPALYAAPPEMAPLVTSGQFLISYLIDSVVPRGPTAPIKFVYPREGASGCLLTAQVAANAPHPNAARLYLNYRLTRESQNINVRDFGLFSMRTDMANPPDAPADFKIWTPPLDFEAKHPDWRKEWLTIFDQKL